MTLLGQFLKATHGNSYYFTPRQLLKKNTISIKNS
jgi:hypothetical protein